ncbi:MAG: acyl carrier protein [Gemmatimonadetes bacterium]|nr:acyl carrier protein [Gemmatimonadota bacterium]
MTDAQVLADVRQFIVENFLYMRPEIVLADDDRLLERRLIDSMGIMEVIGFLDERFGVQVPEGDIREANLGSLRAIADYVLRRQHGDRAA